MSLCYDIEGNTVDCSSGDAVGVSQGVSAGDSGAGLTLTSGVTNTSNPVAAQAGASSGVFQSLLNFGTSLAPTISKAISGNNSVTSGLRLQVNPSTGQTQYFNPATGQYLAGSVNTSSSLLGGNTGFILLVVAVVVGFFAFFGRK